MNKYIISEVANQFKVTDPDAGDIPAGVFYIHAYANRVAAHRAAVHFRDWLNLPPVPMTAGADGILRGHPAAEAQKAGSHYKNPRGVSMDQGHKLQDENDLQSVSVATLGEPGLPSISMGAGVTFEVGMDFDSSGKGTSNRFEITADKVTVLKAGDVWKVEASMEDDKKACPVNEEEKPIVVGDIVTLKSDSRTRMTVGNLYGVDKDSAACYWFIDGQLIMKSIPSAVLTRAD